MKNHLQNIKFTIGGHQVRNLVKKNNEIIGEVKNKDSSNSWEKTSWQIDKIYEYYYISALGSEWFDISVKE